MLFLGILLLIAGFITGIGILWTIGIILAVIGLIILILNLAGGWAGPGGKRIY